MELKKGDIFLTKRNDSYKIEEILVENDGKDIFLKCSDQFGRVDYLHSLRVEKIVDLDSAEKGKGYCLAYIGINGDLLGVEPGEARDGNESNFINDVKEHLHRREHLCGPKYNIAEIKVYRSFETWKEININQE